jgi:hypothetical protein
MTQILFEKASQVLTSLFRNILALNFNEVMHKSGTGGGTGILVGITFIYTHARTHTHTHTHNQCSKLE